MCTRPRLMLDKFNRISNKVPCGLCIECRNVRREEYTQRLLHEWETYGYIGSFITLTYRDEDLPILYPIGSPIVGSWFGSVPPAYGSTLSRPDISNFADKMQKSIKRRFGKSGKYILVGEYGDDNHRPHYHGIYLGLPSSERRLLYDTWNKGKVSIDPISHADVRYTLKYIDKQIFGANDLYSAYGDFEPPFAHFSKGLGVEWIKRNLDKFDKFGVLSFNDSVKYTLPPYYRDKFRFQKRFVNYSDSVHKYAKEHNLSLYDAYIERQITVERSLMNKDIRYNSVKYDVDKVELLKAYSKLDK